MKIDKSLVAAKFGQGMKWVKFKEMLVEDMTIEERFAVLEQGYKALMESHESLIVTLKDSIIVREDTPYIIAIDNEIQVVDKLELYKKEDLQYPERFYKVVDGKIVVDKKKVGAL